MIGSHVTKTLFDPDGEEKREKNLMFFIFNSFGNLKIGSRLLIA